MKYEFGVMSSKYELEAENDKDAKVAMCLFLKTSAPIAIYNLSKQGFEPTKFMKSMTEEKYIPKDLMKIMESIQECDALEKEGEHGK